jgi:hypothetical protein
MNGNGNGQGARQRRAQMMAQATMIGREQGPELFYSDTTTLGGLAGGVQTIQIPRTLTLNRPMESITIKLAFRLVVGAYDFTSVTPEHFLNLLSQIQLNGIHRVYGNLTPIQISGATAWNWQQMFHSFGSGNALFVNGERCIPVGSAYTLRNSAGTAVFAGAAGTYDVEIHYEIPLGLSFPASAGEAQRDVSFLYLPQDWADSLQLKLTFGDRTSLGVPQASTTTTFTAYGSATGSPTFSIHLNYSILGAFGNALRPGVVIRNEQSFASFVSLVNRTRLSLLQKQITSNVIFKTGLQSTVTNAPPVFTTLVDNMLDQTQLIVDNKPIRNNSDNMIAKTYGGRNFDTVWPGGYNGFSFVDSQNPLTAYRGDGLQGGSTFEIDTNVISANAANLILMVQEQIFGGPFPPLKPGA